MSHSEAGFADSSIESDESGLYRCVTCRHHMQLASEETCMACFNQNNWDPPQGAYRRVISDVTDLEGEIITLEMTLEELDEQLVLALEENKLLRDENERLRMVPEVQT